MARPPIIGIDLGTTNSLGAFLQGGRPVVIRGKDGEAVVPSVVSFRAEGPPLVGRPARDRRVQAAADTVYSVKRLMGKDVEEIRQEGGALAYGVESGERQIAKVVVSTGSYTPQEISAFILREVKDRASAYFGEEVTDAVVTVPAYFDDAQRQATRDAGRIAGLTVRRIVNEPTAAALAYGLDQKSEGVMAVYDLGGGTFDISILRLAGGVFQVMATCGDTHLGGDDFDQCLVNLAAEDLRREHGIDVHNDPAMLQTALRAAEECKIRLSSDPGARLAFDLPDGTPYAREITREQFEELIAPFMARTLSACRLALKDSGLVAKEIEDVVMVGGSTRIPLVRKTVSQFFQSPVYTDLNPDEVVALGAGVQAGILAGDSREVVLLDVISLSLGLETMGGAMSKLIMRNTPIPARATESFSTYADNQTGVDLNIYQGERELVRDCRSLGRFALRGIPPMPAGMARVQVTFLVDANGILRVTAREEKSGTETSIEVVPSHGLTEDEVRRLVEESIEHAPEDMLAHRLVDLRNETVQVTKATRHVLDELGDAVDAELREQVEAGLSTLAHLAQTDDANAIYEQLNALNALCQPIAEASMDRVLSATVKGRALSDVADPNAEL